MRPSMPVRSARRSAATSALPDRASAPSAPASGSSAAASRRPASSAAPAAPCPTAEPPVRPPVAAAAGVPPPRGAASATAARAPASAAVRHAPVLPRRGGPGRREPLLTVAVDVDEVLGRFLFSLNQFCGETYGLDVDVGDYHVYEFAKVWGCSPDAATEIVHAFFASPHFAAGVPPIPGAAPALRRAASYATLAVVTSRQHAIREPTLAWLDAHFPGLFDGGVHFGNHWAKAGGPAVPKATICADIGASVLVDDNPRYAAEAAAAGLDVLLYDWQGGYPWAKLGPVDAAHPRITVVRDWDEAEAALAALAAARAGGAGERRLEAL